MFQIRAAVLWMRNAFSHLQFVCFGDFFTSFVVSLFRMTKHVSFILYPSLSSDTCLNCFSMLWNVDQFLNYLCLSEHYLPQYRIVCLAYHRWHISIECRRQVSPIDHCRCSFSSQWHFQFIDLSPRPFIDSTCSSRSTSRGPRSQCSYATSAWPSFVEACAFPLCGLRQWLGPGLNLDRGRSG